MARPLFHFLLSALYSVLVVSNSCPSSTNGCITFSVTQGTGCAWMCNYCATNLGTNNYYFTGESPVCIYQEGQGCVGNPIAGQSYTCCSN